MAARRVYTLRAGMALFWALLLALLVLVAAFVRWEAGQL